MMLYNVIIIYILCLYPVVKPGISKKRKIIYLFITILPLLVLSACKSDTVGADTIAYVNIFEVVSDIGVDDLISISDRYEPLFILFVKTCSEICEHVNFMFLSQSLITYTIIGLFIFKYSKNCFMALFLFITMRYYFFFLSNLRQTLAVVFCIIIFDGLVNRDNKKIFINSLLAMGMHLSSTLFVMVTVFANFKNKINYRYIVFVAVIFCSIFILFFENAVVFFPKRYTGYSETTYYLQSFNLASCLNFTINIILSLLLLWLVDKQENISKKNGIILVDHKIIRLFALMSMIFSGLSLWFGMMMRICYYFSIFYIIFIPNLLTILKKNDRIIVTSLIFIGFMLYMNIILELRPEWNCVTPFNFFWEN